MNPKVDFYFSKHRWQEELAKLRKIVLECGLVEELKWGVPCYTFQNNNVVLIHTFKEYCALLFHKGVLLKDPNGILVQQTKNVRAARQIRFTSAKEIVNLKSIIKAYIKEAIDVEKAGLKVELKKTSEFEMPSEFKDVLVAMPEVKAAFYKLTPGRQRGYLLHFATPKQSKTRESRIEKCIKQILSVKGLDDK